MSAPAYHIKLPQFEGPFDLLLFFIERDELDIYNIPINQLTKDFLAYIKQMESLNIELASEFILFISTLMRIKAKMLLPRKELDASGTEIDPRQELIDKILEYKRFKEAASSLQLLETERLRQLKRGNATEELQLLTATLSEGTEIQTVTVYKLMHAFEKVIKRLHDRENKPQHVILKYNYSQEGQRNYLIQHLAHQKKVTFEGLFLSVDNKIQAIFTFLAMLELIQVNRLNILVGVGRNNFIVEWNNQYQEPINIDIFTSDNQQTTSISNTDL